MKAESNNIITLNFISLGSVQAINASLQLLVIPFVFSRIGADGFGVVAVAQVVVIYLSTFSEFGIYQTATRKVALYNHDPDRISNIFSTVFFSRIILCLLSFLLLLILLFAVPVFRSHSLVYLMAFSFVIGQSFLMNWFFQGLEKMWVIVLTTLFGRVLCVVLVFLFIKNKEDDFLYLFFLGIGNIAACLAGILIAFRIYKLRFKKVKTEDIKNELKDGWQYTLSNLSMNTCQYANIFILRFFTNDIIVGYFSIAEKIFITVKQVLSVFSQSIYPGLCRMIVKGKPELNRFLRKTYLPFLICIMAGSTLLYFISPQVLYFFSGQEAIHSVFILRMLCIVLVVVCLNIPSTLSLLALNRKKEYFRIFILGGLLNIISNIILASFFQANGTILAIFLTEIFITTSVVLKTRNIDFSLKSNLV
jgi:polysaccharide transporter, PST family